MYEAITRYLKEDATPLDKKLFHKWEICHITTKECLDQFKENNRIFREIDLQEFERWLYSLGYAR